MLGIEPIEQLVEIGKKYNIPIIEDVCEIVEEKIIMVIMAALAI